MRKFLAVILSLFMSSTAVAAQWMSGYEARICQGCEAQRPKMYQGLKSANVTYIRYMINWDGINPSPGIYNWQQVDSDLVAMKQAGLKPYFNITWAPAHVSENKPTYRQYLDGCTKNDIRGFVFLHIGNGPELSSSSPLNGFARKDLYRVPRGGTITIPAPGVLGNDLGATASVTREVPLHGTWSLNMDGSFTYTHDGSAGDLDLVHYWTWGIPNKTIQDISFADDELEICSNPPHIDPNEVRDFTKRLIDRYGDEVDFYGIWNEPGLTIYFPPEGPDKWDRYVNEILLPFVETVRAFDPSAKIIGPECESPYCMEGVLSLEKVSGQKWFDILSLHPYPWTLDFEAAGGKWPEAAVHRLDMDFKPVYDKYAEGRPAWASEIGGATQEDAIKFSEEVQTRPWVKVLSWQPVDTWFEPGTIADETFVLSAFGRYTQTTSPAFPKRRAVRHSFFRGIAWQLLFQRK